MQLKPLLPSQALDLAFRRQKVTRATLTAFEQARQKLLAELDAQQDEADIAEPLRRFFRALGFANFINSRKKRDLVLHSGPDAADPLAIIFELKHQKNKAEMVQKGNLNRKALHELLLYYFQERTSEQQALELRQLVITTGYEWFIFDAHEFHRVFWKNTELRTFFQKHKQGQTTAGDTAFFYQTVKDLLDKADTEIRFTYLDLDLRDEHGQRREPGERTLLWLSKLFSAPHLLKEPFAQDANTLNRAFYEELLYLMGLEEVKDKGRKLIQRCAPERRQRGSLLENTLVQLRAEDMLRNLPPAELATYGDTPAAQAEGVALALGLTWVSRLLFLKLLEGQLRRYHAPHDAPFRFLDPAQLPEYDQLNLLFYRVLNRPPQEREEPEAQLYRTVPYLNSSLFEPSALERLTLRISGLDDRLALPLLGGGKGRRSVLRQEAGAAAPAALTYLLRFLDAYDFASEGEEGVQDDERPLISAAVLGLIFEKINGYRDGSFYTPGFITMYMCRHTLRRAVVRHFNERFGLEAADVAELRELLDDRPRERPAFSAAFNELRVCDPAVGSGHFLVSALNELLALKSELHLLLDDEGKRLRYTLTVARDELAITDDEELDTLVQYRAHYDAATHQRQVSRQHSRLQSALFREKRQLIEHCLYGVDLNPNSVRICRLRLWIELLKHAYYTPESHYQELETLPNLDLNVRAGNSLIGRFALEADLTDVFRRKDTSVAAYRRAFGQFFSARGREAKQELQDFLARLKEQFSTAIQRHDPLLKRIARVKDDLLRVELDQKPDLFGKTQLGEEDAWARRTSLQLTLDKLEAERQQREQGALYRDAFEWRFEFPEVLDAAGAFRGFDVVLGNPPYIRQEELPSSFKGYLQQHFATSDNRADLYVYFIELGLKLLAPGGELSFITSNKWLSTGFGAPLRRWLPAHHTLIEYIDFGDLYVFPQTKAYPAILSVQRVAPLASSSFRAALIPTLPTHMLDELVALEVRTVAQQSLKENGWTLSDASGQLQLDALRANGTPLGEYVANKIYYGIKTGLNPAFVINAETRAQLIAEDAASADIIKPFLAGRDLKRYRQPQAENYLILLPSGWTRKQLGWTKNKRGIYAISPSQPNFATPWEALTAHYPAVANYLLPFETVAAARSDKGNYWWELRACDYYDQFACDKIMWKEIATYQEFTLDKGGNYANNKTFFIPSHDLFLLGVLNSASVFFFLQEVTTKMKDNAMAMQIPQVSQIPIPSATPEQQVEITGLVEQVLAAKAADPAADTQSLEQQIDDAVAALYGLTPAEVALLG